MDTLSMPLPADLAAKLRDHMASGLFESETHVMHEALRQMEDREYEVQLQKLRDALAEGVRQIHAGEVVEYSMQEIIDELNAGK